MPALRRILAAQSRAQTWFARYESWPLIAAGAAGLVLAVYCLVRGYFLAAGVFAVAGGFYAYRGFETPHQIDAVVQHVGSARARQSTARRLAVDLTFTPLLASLHYVRRYPTRWFISVGFALIVMSPRLIEDYRSIDWHRLGVRLGIR